MVAAFVAIRWDEPYHPCLAEDDVDLSGAEFAVIRALLGKEGTWVEIGQGSVKDLAGLIASCLRNPTWRGCAGGREVDRWGAAGIHCP